MPRDLEYEQANIGYGYDYPTDKYPTDKKGIKCKNYE